MKFSLKDFLELDTKELFAVNGGYYCTGSSGGASPGSPSPSNGQRSTSSNGFSVTDNGDGTVTVRQRDGNSFTYRKNSKSSSSSSGGYCSGASDGKTVYPNPYYPPSGKGGSSTPSATTAGGSCSSSSGGSTGNVGGSDVPPKETDITNPAEVSPTISNPVEKPEITGGSFAQITDGSYADDLTMQIYKNAPYKYQPGIDEKMNDRKDENGNIIEENSFSTDGCKMAGAAKIASEISGKEVSLWNINKKFDVNADGLLSQEEIEYGLQNLVGDDYEVKSDNWKVQLTKDKLSELTSTDDANTTYVLGFAPECFGGHWVVIEGWSTNENGQVVFDYDGTSDNDVSRTYVLGKSDVNNRIYGIERIETFTVSKR